MGKRHLWALMALLSQSLLSKDIVVGVDFVPKREFAVLFTPVVVPDLLSAKAAFEYRLHDKVNLVIPVEAKWMDYRRTIKTVGGWFGAQNNIPESWYDDNSILRSGWNIDLMQLKISSGLGIKYFPFSQSMSNAFYLKTLAMAGYENIYAYDKEGNVDSLVLTGVLTAGYNWVKNNRFTFGFEAGAEYTYHTNPIEEMPILLEGFMPMLQFNLGFTI
jgi:hypothetical protein